MYVKIVSQPITFKLVYEKSIRRHICGNEQENHVFSHTVSFCLACKIKCINIKQIKH